MNKQFQKELNQLDKDLVTGVISEEEYSKLLKEMEKDYLAAAEEAAEERYNFELRKWGW